MCLGIPGQIVEFVDEQHHIAKAEVSGVRRNINVGLLSEGPDAVQLGDWVLILVDLRHAETDVDQHPVSELNRVGFGMSKIDEEEARATREFLEALGDP